MGKQTNDIVNVDELIAKDTASGNVVDVNSLIANGTIKKKVGTGIGLFKNSQSESTSSSSAGNGDYFNIHQTPEQVQQIFADAKKANANNQNESNKLRLLNEAKQGNFRPVSSEQKSITDYGNKVWEKDIAARNEAIDNTLQKKYEQNNQKVDKNSAQYKKDFNDLLQKTFTHDVVRTTAKDGKQFVVPTTGFWQSAGESLVNSFKSLGEGAYQLALSDKELAKHLEKRAAERPYLPEHVPSPFLGEMGVAAGGVPKMAGELSIPVVGLGVLAADAQLTGQGAMTEELYNNKINQLKQQGKEITPELKNKIAGEARDDAFYAALPNTLMNVGLGIAHVPEIENFNKSAQNFGQLATKTGGKILKMGLLGGTSEAASSGIEKAQGYDITAQDILNNFGKGAASFATMEAGFRLFPFIKQAPSALRNSYYDMMSKVPKPIFEQAVQNMGEDGRQLASDVDNYVQAKSAIDGLAPDKDVPLYVDILNRQNELNKANQELELKKQNTPKSFHDEIDNQIKHNEAEINSLDDKIAKMKKSATPEDLVTDHYTGEPLINKNAEEEVKEPNNQTVTGVASDNEPFPAEESSVTEKGIGETVPQASITPSTGLSRGDEKNISTSDEKGAVKESSSTAAPAKDFAFTNFQRGSIPYSENEVLTALKEDKKSEDINALGYMELSDMLNKVGKNMPKDIVGNHLFDKINAVVVNENGKAVIKLVDKNTGKIGDKVFYKFESIEDAAKKLHDVKEGFRKLNLQTLAGIESRGKETELSKYGDPIVVKKALDEAGIEVPQSILNKIKDQSLSPNIEPKPEQSGKVTGEQKGTSVLVAPYYDTQISNLSDASKLRESEGYKKHNEMLHNVANIMGVKVLNVNETIGGFTNSEGNKITEISNRVNLDTDDINKAEEYAAVVGALSHETQEATIASKYVKHGDPNQSAIEVEIKVDNLEKAHKALKDAGIDDFELNESDNTIKILDFSNGEDLDFDNRMSNLADHLDKNNIKYETEHHAIESRYVSPERRSELLKAAKLKAEQSKSGTDLRNLYEEATAQSEYFLNKKINKEDAIQKQTTGKVDVGDTSRDGGEMGSGDTQQKSTTKESKGESEEEKVGSGEPPIIDENGEIKGGDGISIIHAATADLRKDFGLPEYEKNPETIEKWHQEANERIAKGEMPKLLGKMSNGHIPTDVEQLMMGKYIAALNEKAGQTKSDADLLALKRAVELSDLAGGSEWGKSGRARQEIHLEDDTLGGMLFREMENSGVDKLTDEQKATVEKEFNDIQAKKEQAQKDLDELLAKQAAVKAEIEFNRQKNTRSVNKTSKEKIAAADAKIKKGVDGAREALKKLRTGESGLGASVPLVRELVAIAPHVKVALEGLIDKGVVKLSDAVKELHEQFKDLVEGITEKDIHNIIAGEYNEKKKTKSQLAALKKDIIDEAKYINKLEKLLQGEEPKDPKKKVQRNQEITALKNKISAFKKEQTEANKFYGEEIADDYKKLQAFKNRNEKELEKINEQLRSGNFDKEQKTPLLQNKELKSKYPDLYKKALESKDNLIKAQQQREIRMLKEKYANRSRFEKNRDLVLDALNVPRALMSSVDFSAPLRQGLIQTVAHPDIAKDAAAFMFKAASSQKVFDRFFYDLKEHPRYADSQKSGLSLTDPHDPILSAKEEQFMTNLAQKIPVAGGLVKGSERAYVGYLNKLRWDLYNRYADAFEMDGKTFENSEKLYKALGEYINSTTGRGSLGKFEESAKVLNALFFSPRLIASRLRLLTNFANPNWYYKTPKEVRTLYFKDMGKFIGAGLTTLGLAALAGKTLYKDDDKNKPTVELDPRSSDFFKIKIGDTRYDIWGGFQQYIRAASQLFSGTRKTSTTGELQHLTPSDRFNVFTTFGRGKLSPVVSTGLDFITGETVTGDRVQVQDELLKNLIPLTFQDIASAVKDNGVKSIFTVGVPTTFGVGVQTYTNTSNLESLYDRNLTSYQNVDINKIKKYVNNKPVSITKDEFRKYTDLRDKYIKEGIDNLYNKGLPVIENYKVTVKSFKDLTPIQVQAELKKIKAAATDKAKQEMFPVPEGVKEQNKINENILKDYKGSN